MTPIYLTIDDVLAIHGELMGTQPSSARDHVRDENLLDSALNRPKQAAHYEAADLVQQAATLLWGLVRNHPFHDGNKRTGYVVMLTFLQANGWDIQMSTSQRVALVEGAATQLAVDDVDRLLRANLTDYQPPE